MSRVPEARMQQTSDTPELDAAPQKRLPDRAAYYRPTQARELRRKAGALSRWYESAAFLIPLGMILAFWAGLWLDPRLPGFGFLAAVIAAFLREVLSFRAKRRGEEAERLDREHRARYASGAAEPTKTDLNCKEGPRNCGG